MSVLLPPSHAGCPHTCSLYKSASRRFGRLASTAQVRTADKEVISMQHEGPADIVVINEKGVEHNVHLPRAFLCATMHELLSVKQLV